MKLTHTDRKGRARMVDVTMKASTAREATAKGAVLMKEETLGLILANEVKKGDVLGVAMVAGIQAAKKTSELIPLCHPISITGIEMGFTPRRNPPSIEITATVRIASQTGVEMEAMTAVATAALTIYDMCKAADKAMVITDIRLMKKSGGRTGIYIRKQG